jgi:pimeloyl-ACP methyl ester carboxylesterase
MERARTDGAELEYEVSGRGEPAVFIHGAFIADTFRPLLAEPSLAGRYRLILYHRRGYAGSSRASGPVSVARQAADCRALLRHVGVKRAHVVGHSYGGIVALQLALDVPGVAHSLALLEPGLMVGASAQDYRESLARGVERSGSRRGGRRGRVSAGAVAGVPCHPRGCAAGSLRSGSGRRGDLVRARGVRATGLALR